jgi:hypothetical protein
MNDASRMGNNRPPPPRSAETPDEIRARLDYEAADLLAREQALEPEAKALLGKIKVVTTPGEFATLSEMRGLIAAVSKAGEERRKVAKAPFLEGSRTVDGWFGSLAARMTAMAAPLVALCDAWVTAEAKRARAEAEARAAAAAKLAAEAAEAARRKLEEERKSLFADTQETEAATEAAMKTRKAAEAAAAAAVAPVADAVRTYSAHGAVGTGEEVLEIELVDAEKVERRFLVPDVSLARAALKALVATPEMKAAMRKRLDGGEQPFPGFKVSIAVKSRVRW